MISIWLSEQIFGVNFVKAAETGEAGNVNKVHFITLKGETDAILLESNGRFGMVDSGEDTDFPDGSDSRYPFREGIAEDGFEDEVIEYKIGRASCRERVSFFV